MMQSIKFHQNPSVCSCEEVYFVNRECTGDRLPHTLKPLFYKCVLQFNVHELRVLSTTGKKQLQYYRSPGSPRNTTYIIR